MSRLDEIPPVLLVGGGRMGAALLAGWRERGLAPSVVVDPAEAALALAGPGVTVVGDAGAVPAGFSPEALVLAVKPQMAAEVLPAYRIFAERAVSLSIMAGRTIAGIQGLLDSEIVVRAMPNTPAAIRQGFSVLCAAPSVDADGRALCQGLLAAIGEVAWVAEEAALDAVTAVSGSGPAYVFLLAELLEQAALDQGLPAELARAMARSTGLGLRRPAGGARGGCGRAAAQRDQPGRNHRGGARGADGRGGMAASGARGNRRRDRTVPPTGGLTRPAVPQCGHPGVASL